MDLRLALAQFQITLILIQVIGEALLESEAALNTPWGQA